MESCLRKIQLVAFVVLLLLSISQLAAAKSVIAFAMAGGVSHQAAFGRVGLELMERGHNFAMLISSRDILTQRRFAKDPFASVRLIKFNGPEDIATDGWLKTLERDPMKMMANFNKEGVLMVKSLLSDNATVAALRAEKFDVVLRDMAWWPTKLLPKLLQAPTIDITSAGIVNPFMAVLFATTNPLAYSPQMGLGMHPGQGFSFRFFNYIQYLLMRHVVMNEDQTLQRQATAEFGYTVDGSWLDRSEAPVSILGSDWAIEYPFSVPPMFQLVGPLGASPAKEVPQELARFLSSGGASKAVYASMGTAVRILEPEMRGLAANLAALKRPVLWKLSAPELPGNMTMESLQLPAHVHVVPWAPQNDILAHEAVGVFVTHGGSNSIYEAAYHGTPVVTIPFIGDQPTNAAKAVFHGYGVTLTPSQLADTQQLHLQAAVEEVARTPSFKANAVKVQKRLRSRSQTPAQRAADIIEHALDTDCEDYLNTREHLYTWWQLEMLDVKLILFGGLAVIICIVAGLVWGAVRLIQHTIRSLQSGSKQKVV